MVDKKLKKILLVEDDEMLIRMYLLKLEMEGFKVTIAHNGEEGLAELKKKQFDVVLLDLMMPRMDGFQMMEDYNKDKKSYNEAPIIVLSNLGQKEDLERAYSLGIEEGDYIVKASMTPTEVIECITKKLE